MTTLGQLLGSAARTELLRVLRYQPGGVGLRHAARIAGVHPHSVELALRGLVHDGLVRSTSTAAGPLYEMNREHPDAPVLEAVFDAAALAAVRQRSAPLQRRGGGILPSIEEAIRMLAQARKHGHVT